VALSGLTSYIAASIEKFRCRSIPLREPVASSGFGNNDERLSVYRQTQAVRWTRSRWPAGPS